MHIDNKSPLHETSRQLTVAFLVAYVVGGFLVQVHPVAPCVPLLLYALLGFFLTRDQRNSERFADSLYYLGFLLTLTALFLALWQLSKENRDPLAIAGALGAGLSASILGLGLRVVIVQFRGTVSDQEEETRQSIEVQASKVKQALEVLEQGWKEATGVLNSLRADLEAFRTSMNKIQEDTLKTAQQRQTELLNSSAQAAKTWDLEIANLRDKFSQIDIPPTLVREAFARVVEDFGKTAAQIVAGAAAVIQRVTAKFAMISDQSDTCGAALAKLTASMAAAGAATDQIETTAKTISASMRTAGDELGAALTHSAENVGKSASAMDKHLTSATTNIANVAQSLQTAVHGLSGIVPTLQRLELGVNEAATAVAAVEADVKKSTAALATEVEQVGADVKQVRQATGELVELARSQLASP